MTHHDSRPRRGGESATTSAAADLRQLSSPTHRVLFGPLTSADVSGAVVRRLRAAIGLGLLADGDRLPREADLAAQLGITTFSLREALGELRDGGLLVTRAGKNGGSFVTYPPESDDLERDELARLTSVELRDLGDWRLMLASHTAMLASQRATESNHALLTAYAEQVVDAAGSQQARRAHGRFHVELASAAQSMRLARAEFGVHEELDWLFGLALETPERRQASSSGLLEIVTAVRSRKPRAARQAAERYSASLLDQLIQLRLEAIAGRQQRLTEVKRTSLVKKLETFTGALLRQLTLLAEDAASLFTAMDDERALRRQMSLAIVKRMADIPPLVDNIGVLAEVGLVPGHRYWLDGWRRTEDGPERDNSHVTNPAREDFYDYEFREFIAKPRELREPWATGPYVDYGGMDDYIITFSVPVMEKGDFFGVATLDFLVADLERMLAPWLATTKDVCMLVNSEGRVIVSNSVRHASGDVLSSLKSCARENLSVLRWSLITGPDELN